MSNKKERTANERFGASGGVARPKVSADLQVLRPSERQRKPRLRQAAKTLHASGGQSVGNEMNKLTLNKIINRPKGHKKEKICKQTNLNIT
jgi:hypothetical protein